jgi:hypothetical protein
MGEKIKSLSPFYFGNRYLFYSTMVITHVIKSALNRKYGQNSIVSQALGVLPILLSSENCYHKVYNIFLVWSKQGMSEASLL